MAVCRPIPDQRSSEDGGDVKIQREEVHRGDIKQSGAFGGQNFSIFTFKGAQVRTFSYFGFPCRYARLWRSTLLSSIMKSSSRLVFCRLRVYKLSGVSYFSVHFVWKEVKVRSTFVFSWHFHQWLVSSSQAPKNQNLNLLWTIIKQGCQISWVNGRPIKTTPGGNIFRWGLSLHSGKEQQ